MKANELRIGNLVLTNSEEPEILKIDGIKTYDEKSDYSMVRLSSFDKWTRLNDILPIPLTEEWLLKFGFEKKKDYYNRYYFSIDGMDIKIDGDEFATEVGECLYKTIKYVHQLQNLYFALNDEELTIM